MTILLDVYAADAPTALTPMATIEDAFDKSFSVSLNKPGAGQFSIRRDSPNATEELIAQGNLVRVRLDDVSFDPVAAFYMETGDFTLVSRGESGGEVLTFGGRGPMSIIDRGIMWSEAFRFGQPQPVDGVWLLAAGNHGPKAGAILHWILDEMGVGGRPGGGTISDGNIDFTATTDSNGDTWAATPATAEFTARVGQQVNVVIEELLAKAAPMVLEVTPDLIIRAYNSVGVDHTGYYPGDGIVRLEKGYNLATDLTRQMGASKVKSTVLVAGDPGFYGWATLPINPHREAFVQDAGIDTAALDAIAEQELARRVAGAEAIRVAIPYGDLEGVEYKPGPVGSLGHYWLGDNITLHTGVGPHDYNESAQRIVEIAVGEDDAGVPLVEVALGSTFSLTESDRFKDFVFQTVREAHVGPHS